jgi:hypothetical protein
MKIIISVFVLLALFTSTYAKRPDQPNMTAARTSLQQAKAELNAAEHNKDGHRAKALEYVNAAIGEINRGIEYDRTHNNHALSFVSLLPDQPHMKVALDRLIDAKASLEKATADKGGHRVKAIDFVSKAIDEVNLGIAAAK